MRKLRVLDLFSGIGGFSLGLERTGGFETVAFCEVDPFCRRVLATHWPKVPCYNDVRFLSARALDRAGIQIDVICGGFPCQDISLVGNGAGLDGKRSGLWSELSRLVAEIGPAFVIIENVSALRSRGLEIVLGRLNALGYDAEWHCIPACALDAPHERDRIWIVAYLPRDRWGARRSGRPSPGSEGKPEPFRPFPHPDAYSIAPIGSAIARQELRPWDDEPEMDRVVDGLPYRLVEDELRALGNAVVPQIPELIGRAILHAVSSQAEAA